MPRRLLRSAPARVRSSHCVGAPASATDVHRRDHRDDGDRGDRRTGLSAWRTCGGKLQCATLTVPVDYSQPDGEQVDIAVARLRATQPGQRLGSLVFNFGGPGDAGTETLPGYAAQIPAAVRARYDLVSFDPRGTGKSRPVRVHRRRHRRPAQRGRPHAELRRRPPRDLRRHLRPGRRGRPLRRPQRFVARAARQPQRGTRPRSAARPRSTRRR